jgi:hypothetical protein
MGGFSMGRMAEIKNNRRKNDTVCTGPFKRHGQDIG